jgi:hypothetical protein
VTRQLPPRLLPILYFAAGHVALATAFAAVAIDPRGAAGFFYHARMLAIVHLITLGWITTSILGSLYLVGPIALRVWIPATRIDYGAFALAAIGIVGMVGHFWIAEYAGMAWSGCSVAAGILLVGARVLLRLRGAALPRAVSAHLGLAFINVAAAAALGILIGFDKVFHFLPGFVLANVFAHAHLAAIGWASMVVVGVGYRLLPMVLPSAMPRGPRLWSSAVLLESGVVGLFVSLLVRSRFTGLFAAVIVAGFGAFVGQVAWMIRRPRPRPAAVRLPDPAVLHAAAAFASLAIACVLGLWLAIVDPSPSSLRVATAYGVFGLVGFLAQMVVAMEGRLLPLFAWYWAYANSGYRGPVPSPHEMPARSAQELVFVLWLFGVPALAIGLAFDAVPFVVASAWALLAATLVDSANVIRIVRHAFRVPSSGSLVARQSEM